MCWHGSTGRTVKERSRARGWALQALYSWESRGEEPDSLMVAFAELAGHLRISEKNRFYAEILLRLVANNLPLIDRTLQNHLTNWSLARLSVIDRDILRLGVAEMLFVDDVPTHATVNEMMHLAQRYSTPESPRFVKGVLDGVARTQQGGESHAPPGRR